MLFALVLFFLKVTVGELVAAVVTRHHNNGWHELKYDYFVKWLRCLADVEMAILDEIQNFKEYSMSQLKESTDL